MYSESDSLIPAPAVRKAVSKMKFGEGFPFAPHVGHFDPYVGEEFERTWAKQADFLESCLNLK